jgi:putative phage-type endonuclease
MNGVILKTESREAWLSQRTKGLGGTDISAILGVNKYKTPFDVWEDKTGRGQKFEGNKMTRRGQYMEDAVANYFADVSGHRIIKASDTEEMLIHPTYPFLLGSPDRRYFDSGGGKGILECKTTMSRIEADLELIPQSWFIQLQWYMGLTGYRKGTIAWSELGFESDFKHLEVEINQIFYSYMVGEAVKFWTNYVIADTPPPPVSSADIEKMYVSHTDNKYITATDELFKAWEELKELKKQKKEMDEIIESKEETIKLAIGDAEGARFGDTVLCTWKSAKGSIKFDDKALKEADPSLWSRYTKEVPGSRRFLLK